MAIVTFEIKDFKHLELEQQKLESALVEMGIEIEEKTDTEMKINATPNRPDLLDFNGLIRAIENYVGKKNPKEGFYNISGKPALTIEVTDDVHKVRPYIAGMVVKNVNLSGNMLKYLINFTEKFADTYGRRRKKLAIGIHDLSAIKGNVVYTAGNEDSFIPLNGTEKMSFAEIMKRHEKGIAYASAVPGTLYPFIKDSEKILAMIPITNSDATKVTEKTKDIFIDITGTSLVTIRNAAVLIACSFLYAGAEVLPVTVSYPKSSEITPELKYDEIKINMKKADKILGIDTSKHDVKTLAHKMGYTALQTGNAVVFSVPPYRMDVLNEQDVVEDIAIAYGYDRIIPKPVVGVADGLAQKSYEFENRLATVMVGLGYTEAINSMLTNEKTQFENFGFDYKPENFLRIADAKTENITMLRFSLMGGLMQNLSDSRSERMPQRLFEIGSVFTYEGGKIKENIMLAMVSEHSKANFAEVKNVIDRIMKFLGHDYTLEKFNIPSAFIEGRHALVKVKDETVGGGGEIHPQVLLNFGLEEPVVCAGITITKEVKYD